VRIVYFAPEYHCGHGGRTHAREFFAALARLSEVAEATVYPPAPAGRQGPLGLARRIANSRAVPPTARMLMRMAAPRRRAVAGLVEAVQRTRADAVILRVGGNFPLVPRVRRALPDVTLCVEMNATVFAETYARIAFRRRWERYEADCLNYADGLTVVSTYGRDYLAARGVPPEKVLVNPNGVDPGRFDPSRPSDRAAVKAEFQVPEGAFVFGYVGGMDRFRRLPEVVRQVAELRRNGHDDLFLLLVGDGPGRPAVEAALARHRDVMDGWAWCGGRRPYERMPHIMQAFDVGIFPFSNPYGSPLKLYEYLAMGLPAIGPAVPAVKEAFEDGRHLLLVPQERDGFADAVLSLKTSPGLARRLAEAGQQYVLSRCTWRHNAERVVAHVRKHLRPRATQ
jgi:glycosyltransferase involved in cell wall biosynthesis